MGSFSRWRCYLQASFGQEQHQDERDDGRMKQRIHEEVGHIQAVVVGHKGRCCGNLQHKEPRV